MMNNQIKDRFSSLMNLRTELIDEHGVDRKLTDLVLNSITDLDEAGEELHSLAGWLQDKATSIIGSIIDGKTLNSLGELQARGSEIDQLCRLRQTRIESVKRITYVLPDALIEKVRTVAFTAPKDWVK
jgi:hypothetical protein